MPTMESTQDYLLRNIPLDLYRQARTKAFTENTSIRRILLKALIEFVGESSVSPDTTSEVSR